MLDLKYALHRDSLTVIDDTATNKW